MRVLANSISATVMVALIGMAAAQSSSPARTADKNAVRVLDDASTGDRWRLERDLEHPGGPGRLVREEGGADRGEKGQSRRMKSAALIHGGDRVTVVEETEAVQMRLQGVALGSAARGDPVKVKLAVSNGLVRGIVEAPGRVRLVGEAR